MLRRWAAYLHCRRVSLGGWRVVVHLDIRDKGEASGTSWLAIM
jgi:hypothetical protein